MKRFLSVPTHFSCVIYMECNLSILAATFFSNPDVILSFIKRCITMNSPDFHFSAMYIAISTIVVWVWFHCFLFLREFRINALSWIGKLTLLHSEKNTLKKWNNYRVKTKEKLKRCLTTNKIESIYLSGRYCMVCTR